MVILRTYRKSDTLPCNGYSGFYAVLFGLLLFLSFPAVSLASPSSGGGAAADALGEYDIPPCVECPGNKVCLPCVIVDPVTPIVDCKCQSTSGEISDNDCGIDRCTCYMNYYRTQVHTHITVEFQEYRRWLIEDLWAGTILPNMMGLAEEVTAMMVNQVEIVGEYFDAKMQMETQHLLRTLTAQAVKDYQPSESICEFATVVRSIAATERMMEFNTLMMASRALDRQLGKQNASAADGGAVADINARLAQFRAIYCDPKDFNENIGDLCLPDSGGDTAENTAAPNRDIDYVAQISDPITMNVNFTDNTLTSEERDLFALASLLYAHKVPRRVPGIYLSESRGYTLSSPGPLAIADIRALIAKRSVAENSYNTIVGLKSKGTSAAVPYLTWLVEQLGYTEEDVVRMVGETPSYYAQMGVLTKTLFQNPQFYVNLYDKPANVERQLVAVRAIKMMQDRDIFESQLRSEAMVSILLELGLIEKQKNPPER